MTDNERRENWHAFRRIDDAFRRGDLEALRQSLDDPAAVPNGRLDPSFGTCLVYAIYHGPLAFVRTLLEMGADPNAPDDDGFPPLIAALGMTRKVPGAPARSDVDDIIRLLLSHGADPNQRGLNDYTPLHMAVAERNLLAVHRLLDAGADPDMATRIDECETPEQMPILRRHRDPAWHHETTRRATDDPPQRLLRGSSRDRGAYTGRPRVGPG